MNRLTFLQRLSILVLSVSYTAAMVLLFITLWWFALVIIALSGLAFWTLVYEDNTTMLARDVDELEEWLRR